MEGGEGKSAEYPILPTTFYLVAVATSDLKEGREGGEEMKRKRGRL